LLQSYQQKAKDMAEERRAAFENLPAAKKEELRDQQVQRLEKRHRLKRLNTLRQVGVYQ
jgi:hypothetical protein